MQNEGSGVARGYYSASRQADGAPVEMQTRAPRSIRAGRHHWNDDLVCHHCGRTWGQHQLAPRPCGSRVL